MPRPRPEPLLARRGGAVELLRLPAAAHGALVRVWSALHDRGLLPRARLDVPVVSVGNLTAGGTGKTPAAHWVAERLRARGRRPGIASRGYAATRRGASGSDEARELFLRLPDVPHEEDPDRADAARRLVARGADVVVLDDGFQHRRLARDLDLVLLDATRPWGLPPPPAGGAPVAALLPRGLLREPPLALARAHAVVLTRVDQVDEGRAEALEREVLELAPGLPVARAVHRPRALRAPGGEALHPRTLAGREVDLLSGIGNPDAFERTVAALGARIASHRRFADHHRFGPRDLRGLGEGGRLAVTTAKDAARLGGGTAGLHALEVELAVVRGEGVLDALLDALPPSAGALRRAALHAGLHG